MKYLLIFFFSLNYFFSFAQNKNLLKQIDSAIVEFDKGRLKIDCNVYTSLDKSNITFHKEDKIKILTLKIAEADLIDVDSLLNYLENKYLKKLNVYKKRACIPILSALLENQNIKGYDGYKANLFHILLNNSTIAGIPDYRIDDKSFINEKSKKRIFDILNNNYRKSEKIMYKYRFPRIFLSDTIDQVYNRLYKRYAKKANMTIIEYSDSINNIDIKDYINEDLSNVSITIDKHLIYLIGKIRLTEFSEKLAELYNDKKYSYLHKEILLELARLQYKDYEQKFYETIKYNDLNEINSINYAIKNLRYIGTQNAMFEISKFLFNKTPKSCAIISGENTGFKEFGYYILYTFMENIDNFPFKKHLVIKESIPPTQKTPLNYSSFCFQTQEMPDDVLEKAFKWMKKNKGKYKIKKGFMYN